MSLGGGRSKVLDRAVDAAVEAGIHFAVAAGNDARDACQYSPAASQFAVTVGASSIDDSMAWFSNHGKCVDVFAPGKDITSAWIGSTVATNTISGTSMASPHVCGLMTLFLSLPVHENKTPKELKDHIIQLSTKGLVTGLPIWSKTENRLIFNDPPTESPAPPPANGIIF
jgi:cerevisin